MKMTPDRDMLAKIGVLDFNEHRIFIQLLTQHNIAGKFALAIQNVRDLRANKKNLTNKA